MTNGEFKIELEKRTVDFSVSVLRLLRKIPLGIESRNIKDQLARSATAIGSNYREANRAESRNDFVHKIAVVVKEASESEYWLLLLKELYPNVSEIAAVLKLEFTLNTFAHQLLREYASVEWLFRSAFSGAAVEECHRLSLQH